MTNGLKVFHKRFGILKIFDHGMSIIGGMIEIKFEFHILCIDMIIKYFFYFQSIFTDSKKGTKANNNFQDIRRDNEFIHKTGTKSTCYHARKSRFREEIPDLLQRDFKEEGVPST